MVSVANNHSLDDGVAGFDVTVDHLRALGARIVGDARRNEGAAVIDVGPHRVGMFALTYGSNRTALRDERLLGFAAVPYRLPHVRVERIVRRLREEQGATHVVALLHWGYEHEHEPGLDQENVVRDLQAAGVDVVIGHHAHVLQRSGAEAGRWVSYSLGDFVGGDRTVWSRFGAMVSLRFDDRGDVHGEVIPIVQSAFWQEQRTSLLEDGPLFERLVFRSFFRAKLPPPHPRARTSAFERSTS